MPDLNESLTRVAQRDVRELVRKDAEYGSSWKKRGGVGAMMMLARKIDRIEPAVERKGWDIFAAIRDDPRSEGIIDDIRDLRRYLMLVEAEIEDRGELPEQRQKAVQVEHFGKSIDTRNEWAPGLPSYNPADPI